MDLMFGLAMVLGIGPALAMMYFIVRNYTYPRVEQPFFSDATFFLLFFVGLVAGSVLFFAMRVMGFASNIIYMVLMSVVQVLAMVVIMNLKRFRGKSDSVFYGYALGLGMSSGMSMGISYSMTVLLGDMALDASIVLLVVIVVSMTLILGACGTNVGEGIARHRVMEFALQALLLLVAYNLLLTGLMQTGGEGGIMPYVCAVVILVLSVVYFYRIMMVKLPGVVRDVLKMNGIKRDDIPKAR